MKSIDPNIEIDEGVLVKDSLLSEISFDVKAYAEVINPLLGEVIITTITEINIINNSYAVEAKYYGMAVHIWNFDKDIKREWKNFYMPSGKLKVGSTAHVEVTKKTTTNNIKKIYVNTRSKIIIRGFVGICRSKIYKIYIKRLILMIILMKI